MTLAKIDVMSSLIEMKLQCIRFTIECWHCSWRAIKCTAKLCHPTKYSTARHNSAAVGIWTGGHAERLWEQRHCCWCTATETSSHWYDAINRHDANTEYCYAHVQFTLPLELHYGHAHGRLHALAIILVSIASCVLIW